jgi:dimethylamine--corrinoid protein Co-methyltransferase
MSQRKTACRMGDGSLLEFTESELKRDIEEGVVDAAEKAGLPPLSQDEVDHLHEIYSAPSPPLGVNMEDRVVFTYDTTCNEIQRTTLPIDRTQMLQLYEKILGADTVELGHVDYSYKAVKPIVGYERSVLEQALLVTTVPVFYGAMPNLGLYTQPDGPVANPSELMPLGKIDEARSASEEAMHYATEDMVFVGSALYESGADGIDFDTTGAAGDPDFLATLRAAEILRDKYPGICIEMGMAGDFILGMHGELSFDGLRLAGLYPHEQVKVAAKAGVTVFGPVINTNSKKSCPWNVARTVTLLKACVEESTIPVHANMGMGVGGIPLTPIVPSDAVARASKAVVEITRLDGL